MSLFVANGLIPMRCPERVMSEPFTKDDMALLVKRMTTILDLSHP